MSGLWPGPVGQVSGLRGESVFKRRWMTILVTVAMAIALPAVAAAPVSADAGSDEATFLAQINQLRASKGVGPLQMSAQVVTVARTWTAVMVVNGTISHNPNLARQVVGPWGKLGENVGMGGNTDSLFRAFVNSPAHYQNLVDPSFNYVGIAVQYSGNTLFTTHDFMQIPGGPPPTTTTTQPPATTTTTTTIAAPLPRPHPPARPPAVRPPQPPGSRSVEPVIPVTTADPPAPPASIIRTTPAAPPPARPLAPERTFHSLDELRVLAALGR